MLKRIREDKQEKEGKKQKKDGDFTKLQEEATAILDGCLSIEHLATAMRTDCGDVHMCYVSPAAVPHVWNWDAPHEKIYF